MHNVRRISHTDVGVLKHKLLTQFVLCPIHLGTNNAEQRLAIDQDLDTILLHRFIESARLINVFQVVCQPATAPIPYTDLDELRIRLVEQCAKLINSSGGELHGRLASSELGTGSCSGLCACGSGSSFAGL